MDKSGVNIAFYPFMCIFVLGMQNAMLSILIPTYNYDCTRLVRDLQSQTQSLSLDYEIIVADDASPILGCRERNRAINTLPHCRFVELPENVGRACIRNRLADYARGEWLLFMDCDAEVISDSFISDYLVHLDADVVCGGLCHSETLPSSEVSLRYAYERRADKRRAARYRKQKPYEQFTPFNFMIRREVFQSIRFNERIVEYGYEDTLFGIALEYQKARIRHIDNPLRHLGIESNSLFLEKTRAALRNLATMEDAMQGHSSLLRLYRLLRGIRLNGYIARWFTSRERTITARLMGENASLCLFFLYKLGYYCKLKR